jgi:sugar phosphate isomerase/epimerase
VTAGPDPAWRLSLNQATTRHLTLEQAVRCCADAGLRGIGLWRDRVDEIGTARAARLVAAAGLTVTSLCRGGFLTAATASGRAAAIADNRRAIEQAAQLGTGVLALVCGGVPDGAGLSGARQMAADGIATLVPCAREHGIRLAIEPLHPMFCADRSVVCTIGQALEIAAPFPAAQVGLMLDTYHVWWDPALVAGIARAGRRLAGFQLSDWVLPLPADVLLGRGHIGDGLIDFRQIDRAVRAAGYDGWTEVEIFNQAIWAAPGPETVRTLIGRYRQHVADAAGQRGTRPAALTSQDGPA